MTGEQLIGLLLYCVPALITGGIAYFLFKDFIKNEDGRRRYLLQKDLQNHATPLRLQAYERMALFLERISPNKLIARVQPHSNDKEAYESLLVATIEQEFEHNLSQQIYITDECWNVITASKNATIQLIRKANLSEKTDSADKLREVVITEMMERTSPTNAALSFVKNEVSEMWEV